MGDVESSSRFWGLVVGENHRPRPIAGAATALGIGGIIITAKLLHDHRAEVPYDPEEVEEYSKTLAFLRNSSLPQRRRQMMAALSAYALRVGKAVGERHLNDVAKVIDPASTVDNRIKAVKGMVQHGRLLRPAGVITNPEAVESGNPADPTGRRGTKVYVPSDDLIFGARHPQDWPELVEGAAAVARLFVPSGSSQSSAESQNPPPASVE